MFKIHKLSLVSLIAICLACTEKQVTNTYIVEKNKFAQIVADFHFVDAASKQMIISNNRNIYIKHQQFKGILEKHNISQAKFDSTVTYYSQRPEEYKAIYEKAELLLVQQMENKKR